MSVCVCDETMSLCLSLCTDMFMCLCTDMSMYATVHRHSRTALYMYHQCSHGRFKVVD